MLRSLRIRNLAIVEEVALDFDAGFTALTGETGAGKSILIDALSLCLGERAEGSAIRTGADRAEVVAEFDIAGLPGVSGWLAERDLDGEQLCIIRRVVSHAGPSRAYLNDRPVSAQVLRDLGELLVDICGQQAYQALRHRKAQLAMLDTFGRNAERLASVAQAYADWQAADEELRALLAADRERAHRHDLLAHQVRELEALGPAGGEYEQLEAEHRVMMHSGRLAEGVATALAAVYEGDGAAHEAAARARRGLETLSELDRDLEPAIQSLAEAELQLGEAALTLQQRLEALEHDPGRQAVVEERLDALQGLARKHRVEPGELPALKERLAAELRGLESIDEQRLALEKLASERRRGLEETASRLSEARATAAAALSSEVTGQIRGLGMPGGEFRIELTRRSDGLVGPTGADDVEFLVAANPGQAIGPLRRVASGGELSRINLAIQVATLGRGAAATLIFDEVDAGVGGAVAEMVGRQLRSLGERQQVLCVTHLPQVATQARQHVRVLKRASRGQTRAAVHALSDDERVEETARMLGGLKITEQTRAHAREMLAAATRE